MRPDGPHIGQTDILGGTENVEVRSTGNSRPHTVTSTTDSAEPVSASTCANESSGSNTHHTPPYPVTGSLSRR